MERVTPLILLFSKLSVKPMQKTHSFHIIPEPPFDFDLNCRVFGFDKPMPEVYKDGTWKRAIRLGSGKLVAVSLRSVGSVDEPKIEVNHFQALDEREKQELKAKLDDVFSFSQDLSELYGFMDKDDVLRSLKQRFYGLKAGSIGTSVFEHIVKSIIQQQISILVAFTITHKMVTRFSEQTEAQNNVFYDFPMPKKFVALSVENIRQCGVSYRKAETIKTIAQKTVDNEFDPEGLKLMPNEQVIETLKKFRGVGTWTAEMVLSAGMKRNATVPAGDLGVRRTFSEFYSDGHLLSEAEVRKIAEDWRDFTKDIVYYISCIERSER
jgi:DNA-3-methyladenine glycosylase II